MTLSLTRRTSICSWYSSSVKRLAEYTILTPKAFDTSSDSISWVVSDSSTTLKRGTVTVCILLCTASDTLATSADPDGGIPTPATASAFSRVVDATHLILLLDEVSERWEIQIALTLRRATSRQRGPVREAGSFAVCVGDEESAVGCFLCKSSQRRWRCSL
jgi:hypothetical protein